MRKISYCFYTISYQIWYEFFACFFLMFSRVQTPFSCVLAMHTESATGCTVLSSTASGGSGTAAAARPCIISIGVRAIGWPSGLLGTHVTRTHRAGIRKFDVLDILVAS